MPSIFVKEDWKSSNQEEKKHLNIQKGFILKSRFLKRSVYIDIYTPSRMYSLLPVLIMNDGQDGEELRLVDILAQWFSKPELKKFILVAIHAGDRMHEYGISGKPDYAGRGSKANNYSLFVISELLPWLASKFPIKTESQENAVIGFSLGGLSAFDLAWHNPNFFGTVGVFSGSFWWRSKKIGQGYTENDRITHSLIRQTQTKPSINIWLQAGLHDENSDRNGNGIIDAVEDTLDLIRNLESKGFSLQNDMKYVLVKNGSHNQWTWSRVMSDFLHWWK